MSEARSRKALDERVAGLELLVGDLMRGLWRTRPTLVEAAAARAADEAVARQTQGGPFEPAERRQQAINVLTDRRRAISRQKPC